MNRFALVGAVLRRPGTVMLLALLATTGIVAAQSLPSFDVASVKRRPADERPGGGGMRVLPGGRFLAPSTTVRQLIASAYELQDVQIIDTRRWTASDRFDIEARTTPEFTVPQVRGMIRALLEERFQVSAHWETRELSVYQLHLAGDNGTLGPQLRPSGPECQPLTMPPNVPVPPPPPPAPPGESQAVLLGGPPRRCLTLFITMATSSHMTAREITMQAFAQWLTRTLGRLVIDRTGLEEPFDLDLTYVSESQAFSHAGDTPAINTAVREQLGLRLESTRAPVEVLVVDRVEPPTEN